MLVLLGPSFAANDAAYALLSQATGMVPYDLKTKCKAGAWGVVRALADAEQAVLLCHTLRGLGFPACVIDSAVGHDPERRLIGVRRLELGADHVRVHLRERTMIVPYQALVAAVRGEVQLGRTAQGSGASSVSSASFRAVNPSANDIAVFREQASTSPREAFAALDLHFATVTWVARLETRSFEFQPPFTGEAPAQELDGLADLVAERAGIRVDRNLRVSSLASFTGKHAKSAAGASSQPPRSNQQVDEHFDAYSRLVGEAERQARISFGSDSGKFETR